MSRRVRTVLVLAGTMGTMTASASVATARCVKVGVYADDPVRTVPALKRRAGTGITVISAYVTAGDALPASLLTTANNAGAELMVTWEPDDGADGANQPTYRLGAVTRGRYDASLRALARQLSQVRRGAILRPMPEMNTPWHAWSGTANDNTAGGFVRAWRHVRAVVRSATAGSRIKMLWAPYVWSSPDTAANAIARYFPGRSEVDLVGADGYNFGDRGRLTWTDPGTLFSAAYQQIEALAHKPFWIAETGSTATGGDKAGWILGLSTLRTSSMPRLAGVVWYDVDESLGNFSLTGGSVMNAFRNLVREGCQ